MNRCLEEQLRTQSILYQRNISLGLYSNFIDDGRIKLYQQNERKLR